MMTRRPTLPPTEPPTLPPTEPWTDAETEELDALEARIEPRVDELLTSIGDLFPPDVIGEMKQSLLSFAVTQPTMARLLKRVGPAPVVEESGTLTKADAGGAKEMASAKRTSGSK